MKSSLAILLFSGLFAATAQASPFETQVYPVEQGNQSFADKKYEEALEKYEGVEEQLPGEARLQFNRGDALFMMQRYKEAREAYLRATGAEDPELRKRNYYNIGNTFLAEGAFTDAIDYYRRALELDPTFEDARFNLELALRSLKQQKDQQNKSKPNNGQKDQKKKDQDKNKDNQSDEKDTDKQKQPDSDQNQDKNRDKKQADEKSDQQKKDEKQPDQQNNANAEDQKGSNEEKQAPGRLSQAQVKDLLDAERENEKPFQLYRFQLPEQKLKKRKVDKDW